MSTIYGQVKNETSVKQLMDLFETSYQDDFFVRIRKEGQFPGTKEVSGSNFCDIGVTFDERTNRVTVVSVIDNIVKGASDQAIQNMIKMLSLDEETGIDFMPNFPEKSSYKCKDKYRKDIYPSCEDTCNTKRMPRSRSTSRCEKKT